ncbi:MAG TPA: integrase [Lachnospiraceae bacterium]|nr:integrase [Lachnospiraceae bacterium]
MAEQNYFEEQKLKDTKHLRELTAELPRFMGEFFRSLSQSTSVKTCIGYAYDLKLFFQFILQNHEAFAEKTMKSLTTMDLRLIESEDIDRFIEFVTYYQKPNPQNPSILVTYKNDEKGKVRKLSAIRSMYRYFLKRKKVIANPASIVDAPKIHDKAIVRLEVNEMCDLLDEVESGENLTKHQKKYHNHTQKRDLAIVTLLMGTGMRVSECVGINISDIDFSINGIKITRKGGNQVVLYFGDEVHDAICDYIQERKKNPADTEDALFLSMQGKRINVRSVQNLVKKYSQLSVKLKNISPHKLRSTYGTNLYCETGDIYLVADVLGHSDVNTTRRHYAQIEDDRRKTAAKIIKLRKE